MIKARIALTTTIFLCTNLRSLCSCKTSIYGKCATLAKSLQLPILVFHLFTNSQKYFNVVNIIVTVRSTYLSKLLMLSSLSYNDKTLYRNTKLHPHTRPLPNPSRLNKNEQYTGTQFAVYDVVGSFPSTPF